MIAVLPDVCVAPTASETTSAPTTNETRPRPSGSRSPLPTAASVAPSLTIAAQGVDERRQRQRLNERLHHVRESCVDAKNTPDSTHIGSITTFSRPDTASIVRARLLTSSARPPNDSAPITESAASASNRAAHGDAERDPAEADRAPPSRGRETPAGSGRARRGSAHFDIGVATSRFSSFLVRALTIEKPTPHRPVLMMFMPSRPGTSQSM